MAETAKILIKLMKYKRTFGVDGKVFQPSIRRLGCLHHLPAVRSETKNAAQGEPTSVGSP